MNVRLDKLLSSQGLGTRRDIKRLLRERVFTVNGLVVKDPSFLVDPDRDVLMLDSVPFSVRLLVYLMLNKPAGVITSTDDPFYRTVMDLLTPPWSGMNLFPVGRLDIDTEGLLILTNDGPLTHRLTSPKTGVDKTYYTELVQPVSDDMLQTYAERFTAGLVLSNGTRCLPASIKRAENSSSVDTAVIITIQEGKYHQVKKMCRSLGNEVRYLKRVSMGRLELDPDLLPGSWRELTADEIAVLRET